MWQVNLSVDRTKSWRTTRPYLGPVWRKRNNSTDNLAILVISNVVLHTCINNRQKHYMRVKILYKFVNYDVHYWFTCKVFCAYISNAFVIEISQRHHRQVSLPCHAWGVDTFEGMLYLMFVSEVTRCTQIEVVTCCTFPSRAWEILLFTFITCHSGVFQTFVI